MKKVDKQNKKKAREIKVSQSKAFSLAKPKIARIALFQLNKISFKINFGLEEYERPAQKKNRVRNRKCAGSCVCQMCFTNHSLVAPLADNCETKHSKGLAHSFRNGREIKETKMKTDTNGNELNSFWINGQHWNRSLAEEHEEQCEMNSIKNNWGNLISTLFMMIRYHLWPFISFLGIFRSFYSSLFFIFFLRWTRNLALTMWLRKWISQSRSMQKCLHFVLALCKYLLWINKMQNEINTKNLISMRTHFLARN